MKNYYLINKEDMEGVTHDALTWSTEHHWIDLQNGHAVIVAKFNDEGAEIRFAAHPNIIRLPHMLSMKTLQEHHPEHHKKLSNLFPNIQPHHRTFDVAEIIGDHHQSFRPTVY